MKRDILLVALAVVFVGCGKTQTVEYTVPILMNSLKHKDPNMRYWAAESLGHFGRKAKAAVPALIEALKDEDTNVRMGVAYALAEIGVEAKDALPLLREATKDREKAVRDWRRMPSGRSKAEGDSPGSWRSGGSLDPRSEGPSRLGGDRENHPASRILFRSLVFVQPFRYLPIRLLATSRIRTTKMKNRRMQVLLH